MNIGEGQVIAKLAQVLAWHAEIVSGAYRFRKLSRWAGTNPEDRTTIFRDSTDDEKLQDSLNCLRRHVHDIWELAESMPERKST